MARLAAALALAALLGGAAGAQTQGDPEARRRAVELAGDGVAAFQEGRHDVALERFRSAYGIYPSPKLRYNIAQALAGLGRELEAAAEYEAFLAEAADAPADARARAARQLADIDGRAGRLEIAASDDGAQVTVDGKAAGTTPLARPVRVAPGSHEVRLERPGRRPLALTVADVRAGELRAVRADLAPIDLSVKAGGAPRPPPAPLRPEAPRGRSIFARWWFWGAVGVVAAGTAATFVLLSRDGRDCGELGCVDF